MMWPNLQSRVWEGPSHCILCKSNLETSDHVFIDCDFTRSVWQLISIALSLTSTWSGPSLSFCFQKWMEVAKNPVQLPILLCWQVWKTRNAALFEEKPPSFHRVANFIIAEMALSRNQSPVTPPSRIFFQIPLDKVVA